MTTAEAVVRTARGVLCTGRGIGRRGDLGVGVSVGVSVGLALVTVATGAVTAVTR